MEFGLLLPGGSGGSASHMEIPWTHENDPNSIHLRRDSVMDRGIHVIQAFFTKLRRARTLFQAPFGHFTKRSI